jgi:hypothetical protein
MKTFLLTVEQTDRATLPGHPPNRLQLARRAAPRAREENRRLAAPADPAAAALRQRGASSGATDEALPIRRRQADRRHPRRDPLEAGSSLGRPLLQRERQFGSSSRSHTTKHGCEETPNDRARPLPEPISG